MPFFIKLLKEIKQTIQQMLKKAFDKFSFITED